MQITDPVASSSRASRPALTERDAVDIWIARWLRIRPRDLIRRYACDPRRLYEIWQEDRFPEARTKALGLFLMKFPTLADRIDPGPHHSQSKAPHPDQLRLFE